MADLQSKVTTLVGIINDTIPNIMELRWEDEELKLYLYGNTGLKDAKNEDILEWKVIHLFDYKGDIIAFLSGYIGGLETISNFDLLMQNQAMVDRIKEKE